MPQINVFQCPACGANLSYDGGPALNFPCQFCGTTVIVPEELRPKAVAQPAPQTYRAAAGVITPDLVGYLPMDKLAELKRLAQSGQELQAIKLYREIFDTSATEAHAAVEKLAAGQPLVLMQAQVDISGTTAPDPVGPTAEAARLARGWGASSVGRVPSQPTVNRSRGAARAAGCSSLILLGLVVGGILAFVVGMMYLPFRLSGSYQQALQAARADPTVQDALGTPIEVDWWPGTGEISCGGDSCSANYIIPIRGSRKSGRIEVMSDSKGAAFFNEGAWVLDAYVIVDRGASIELTPPPTPIPTLSAGQVDATQGAAARDTQQAQATKEAEATATKRAQQSETATAVAQATTEAAETATAAAEAKATAQAVVIAQAGWPVALSDTFADNRLGWPTGAEKGVMAITTTVTGKKYVWDAVSRQSAYGNAFPLKTQPLTDFTATVKVKFVRGGDDGQSALGLVFRHVDQDYGFFGIEPGGNFWVKLTYASGTFQYYVDSSSAIHTQPGEINQLIVRSLGPDLIFAINDEVVLQLSEDLPAGDVGLGVNLQGGGQPVKAEFSDFEVRAPK
jgi:hypothetical protein